MRLIGTCGVVVNRIEDIDRRLKNVDITSIPTAMNDSSPFTLLALVLAFARHKGISREHVSGTSKQSDYLPHFIANHMFYRISLEDPLRILIDHIDFRQRKVPNWNPLSIVAQHMQAGRCYASRSNGLHVEWRHSVCARFYRPMT